ncbi:SDR family oxidoreductase [Aquirufa lenticrescens]
MVRTFDLSNKVVLITGGYGYLGKSIVESLCHHNAIIYVLGRSFETFERTFLNLDKINFIYCDIESEESIKDCFLKVFKLEKRIDILINNAFYSSGQSPENMDNHDWNYGIDGVLGSTFRCIKEIIPYFKVLESGKIINVSSMYGIVAPNFEIYNQFPEYLNPPHYGAAKAGVIQLTKYYASYLGKFNIQVNCVTPGPFPSKQVQKSEEFILSLSKLTCLKRIGEPDELAGVFVLLASDASSYITGQNFIVDGGWTIK